MIIAIDGPAASGKGTLARRLAAHFDFAHLDTGSIYRAVGLKVVRLKGDPADGRVAVAAARTLSSSDLDDAALRTDEIAEAASKVAAIPEVRAVLLDFQREFASHPPGGKAGAVLDGRDIGTVVCPDAEVKLFVTASLETRAQRRLKELRQGGVEAIHSAVLRDMQDRDARDRERDAAPLLPAEDAFALNTTELDADAAFKAALDFIRSRTG